MRNRIILTLNQLLRYLTVFFPVVLVFALVSCSPLKRLQRLERKHPQLFNRENDTVKYHDTLKVIIPGLKMDTILSVQQARKDTVFIYKDGIHTKVFINKDDLYLESKTDTDTITVIRELKIPYKKYISYRQPRDNLRIFAPYIIILFLLLIIWFINRERQQNINTKNKDPV